MSRPTLTERQEKAWPEAMARLVASAVDAIAAAYAANFDPDLCDWTQRKDRA